MHPMLMLYIDSLSIDKPNFPVLHPRPFVLVWPGSVSSPSHQLPPRYLHVTGSRPLFLHQRRAPGHFLAVILYLIQDYLSKLTLPTAIQPDDCIGHHISQTTYTPPTPTTAHPNLENPGQEEEGKKNNITASR